MDDLDLIPLSKFSRDLASAAGPAASPSYRAIYAKILDGELPAVQVRGRWHVRRSDFKVIAEKLSPEPKHKD